MYEVGYYSVHFAYTYQLPECSRDTRIYHYALFIVVSIYPAKFLSLNLPPQ